MWAIICWVALGVIGLATVLLLILLIRRGGPAAPTTGGSSNKIKINLVKWIFIVLFGWILLSIGSCIFTLPRTYSRTAQKIAKEGREWEESLSEIARKATSPAEKPVEKELKEEFDPSVPSRRQMISWWRTRGKPSSQSGWEEMGTEAKFDSLGQLGMVPLINTNFWEGYELQIRPRYGLEVLSALFSDNVDLVDSSSGDLDKKVLASLNATNFTNRLHETQIARDTGLVWVRTDRTEKKMPGDKIGFTVKIVEPTTGNAEYVVKQKRRSVRYYYRRLFRPVVDKKGVRCCTLPLQMMDSTGKIVRVNFDVDITLVSAPEPGKTTVDNIGVDRRLLEENEEGKGVVMLAWVADGGNFVHPVHVSDWRVRLSSEKDVRPYLPENEPDKYPHLNLWFKSEMPVDIWVAVQIGGTERG